MSVSLVARQEGVAASLLFQWRKLERHPLHWMAYLLMVLVVVPPEFNLQDPAGLVWPALAVGALMAAAAVFSWTWQRAFGPSEDGTPASWLSLAALAALLASLGPLLVEAGRSLVAAGGAVALFDAVLAPSPRADDSSSSDALLQIVLLPAGLAALFAVTAKFLASLPRIADDVNGIVTWWSNVRRRQPSVVALAANAQAPWRRQVVRVASVARWGARILCAVALVALLLAGWLYARSP